MSRSPSFRTIRSFRSSVVAVVAVATVLLPLAPAWAHGDEEHGALALSVGFGDEPAYVGQPNSVQLLVTHDGEAVTDLTGLEVDVSFGDASTTLPFEPYFEIGEWGTPGDYRAWFVPSEPGAYTFSIAGEIEGEEVEVSMTSGPDTFSEVIDPAEAAFPPAASGPSSQDLADRIEQEAARTVDAAEAARTAEEAAASAKDTAMAAWGTAFGAFLVAVVALVRTRRKA